MGGWRAGMPLWRLVERGGSTSWLMLLDDDVECL